MISIVNSDIIDHVKNPKRLKLTLYLNKLTDHNVYKVQKNQLYCIERHFTDF